MPRWLKVLAYGATALLVVILLCVGGFFIAVVNELSASPAKPVLGRDITPEMSKDAEKWFGLRFPDSATLLVYAPTSGKDFNLDVKLIIPASELPRLLSQKPFSGAKWTSAPPPDYTMGPAIPQWEPNLVTKFRKAQVPRPDGAFLDVLIDDTSRSVKTIYLSYWQL